MSTCSLLKRQFAKEDIDAGSEYWIYLYHHYHTLYNSSVSCVAMHKPRKKKSRAADKIFLTLELCRRQFRKCCLNAEQSLPTTNGRPSTASKDPNLCQALLKIDWHAFQNERLMNGLWSIKSRDKLGWNLQVSGSWKNGQTVLCLEKKRLIRGWKFLAKLGNFWLNWEIWPRLS